MSEIDSHNIVATIVSNLAENTIKNVEDDLIKLKEEFTKDNDENQFYYLLNSLLHNPDLDVGNGLEDKIKDLFLTKQAINEKVTSLTNALSLLDVRCNTYFKEPEDAITAFFNVLPEFFSTDHFFNELNKETTLLTKDTICVIQTKSYVKETGFVKKQKEWFKKYEDSLDFFLGTQLLSDIFN